MMKNIKRILTGVLSVIILIFISSCSDNSEMFQITKPTAPVLSKLSITKIELDKVNTNNPALTLSWKTADYGVQTSIQYAIQFSSDSVFTTPITAGTINGNNTITFSVNEINNTAGNVGLPPFKWNKIYARIVSFLGTQNSSKAISNIISFNINPFFNYTFKDYFLVGDATAAGWNNNNNNPPLFRDATDNNIYNYTGYFADGAFKVLETLGFWQPQWGTNDNTSLSVNDGTVSDPGTFNLPSGAGFYSFTMNFKDKTFNLESFDASNSTSFTNMSVQGSATPNGSTATAINQSAHDGHIWYINKIHLVPGNLQFITNTGSIWAGSTEFSGLAIKDGGNIPVVVEDDYNVWFNDLTGHYILIPQNL